MADIVTSYDAGLDLTLQVVTGTVSIAEITRVIEAYNAVEQPSRRVLWDFAGAEYAGIPSADVRALARWNAAFGRKRPGGRTAIVVGTELGFGLARMFDIVINEVEESKVSYRVFRERVEALVWLADGGTGADDDVRA